MQSMQSRNNTFINAFRASRKTTLARWFACWCIVYNVEPSIIVQSNEYSLSGEWVREVAKMLFQPSVVEDHWYLFPIESKKEDLSKSSLSNFESTNGVKIAAKSLKQTIRWSNTFDRDSGISARPTLLFLDDIDTEDSVANVNIIEANEKKILGETISALDPLRRKIIFLGNTINEDGIVPRFRNRYKDAKTWDVFQQPLFDDKGTNLRPEVFTDDVVQQLRDDGKTSFNMNYLLIPSTLGSWVFIRQYFDYFLLSHFEMEDWILNKSDMKCWLIIDPAFSTSRKSDDAVVIGLWQHEISKKFYVLDWYADTSAPSRTINAIIVMYNNMVAAGFPPKFISVEDVPLNTQQTKFIDDLKEALIKHEIHIPVYLYQSRVKKEIRIKDNLEPIMSQKGIKFSKNIADPAFVPKMERQFLEFPNWDHDDIIDDLAQWVEVFRDNKRIGEKRKEIMSTPKINPITWQRMDKPNSKAEYYKKLGINMK